MGATSETELGSAFSWRAHVVMDVDLSANAKAGAYMLSIFFDGHGFLPRELAPGEAVHSRLSAPSGPANTSVAVGAQ
jgi:hypothetical protein